MQTTANKSVFTRLSIMMFFQYMLLAVWWIPLAAYLASMGLSRNLTALVLSSMAFGSVVSPMVGMLADRYFKGQYVLAFSNLMVAVMLLLAGSTTSAVNLFVFLLIAMLFYMPTWAITSAIAMANVPSEVFSRVRVFGTIGWIMAGAFSIISVGWLNRDFDGTNLPFFFGAGISLVAAAMNFTLPDTPPKARGQKASLLDIMGFRSIIMLRDRNFSVFLGLFFLSMIPFSMYWSYFSEYLSDSGYRLITVTMSTGQIMEIIILLTVPWFIKRYGLRNTMIVGMIALVVRYVSLYLAGNEAQLFFVLTGAAVHGIIFGYHHLGGQIYTDKKAPEALRSQAQGLIFFVTFAMGLLAGNFICGWIIRYFSSPAADGVHYQWNAIWGVTALMSLLVVVAFMILFKKEKYETIITRK
ncbi:MAG: MFS transporter [Bacteroidetes bacterium]|nr:MAG: MFS transporter [Bacteroidota bacterium]